MALRLIRFNFNNDNHSHLMAHKKLITATLAEYVLSRQLDDLEPTLTQHSYRLKDMVEQFGAKPAEIRALFKISQALPEQPGCVTECWRSVC